jgi:hypothetical protein
VISLELPNQTRKNSLKWYWPALLVGAVILLVSGCVSSDNTRTPSLAPLADTPDYVQQAAPEFTRLTEFFITFILKILPKVLSKN